MPCTVRFRLRGQPFRFEAVVGERVHAAIPVEAGADYALSMHRQNLERLLLWRREHGKELAAAGFGDAEFEELLDLKRARMAYLQEEPSRVKEVMEVFTDPLIVIRGTRRR